MLELAAERGVAAVDGGPRAPPEGRRQRAQAAEADRRDDAAAAARRARASSRRPSPSWLRPTGADVGVARKVLGTLATRRRGRARHQRAALLGGGDRRGARARCAAYLPTHPEGATAAELRDALGVSRKYAIPLLEYFDAQGFTKRVGDLRVLRGVAADARTRVGACTSVSASARCSVRRSGRSMVKRAPVGATFSARHRPAVQVDEPLGDREPESGAAAVGGSRALRAVEAVEDAVEVGLRDAGAVVGHARACTRRDVAVHDSVMCPPSRGVRDRVAQRR